MPPAWSIPAALLVLLGQPALARQVTVTYRNTVGLPASAADQFGAAFTVTGLSGIGYTGGDSYVAVMDNSNKVVTLSVRVADDGSIALASIVGGVSLDQSHDDEGIAPAGPASSVAYISEEDTPAVRVVDLWTGHVAGTLALPEVYLSRWPNMGLESLALSRDGGSLWTVNEDALSVDGPTVTASIGSTVRLLRYTRRDGAYEPGPQFAYGTDRLHGLAISGSHGGVSDLVCLPDGRLLALERSLALGTTLFQSRIYLLDLGGATDVSGLPSLVGQAFTPVGKTLLHRGDHANMEGLCLGPRLGPGRYAMIGIVDDGDPISTNALIAFEIRGVAEAPCYPNCDGSTQEPRLNVLDFACFLNAFSAGAWYADCDGATAPPVLNVNDFACFLNAFAAGCS